MNMDENKSTPQNQAAAPEETPAAAPSTPATQPAAPGTPATPPAAPTPADAGYESQYATTPTSTQPVPAGQPMPVAPVSATPALVCGILAIVFCGIPIVGIILGIIAIMQAGKYFKAGGTEGTAKGGKICGIIGIVLSGLMIIFSCVLVFIGLSELQNYDNAPTSTNVSSSALDDHEPASSEDEQAIYAAVDPYLDQIKNKDPEMVATIASMMEQELNDSLEDLDITLADCGIDPQQMALAMMEGFDYEPYYASVEGATAEANYMVTVRDNSEISQAFYDNIVELFSNVEAGSMTEAEIYQTIGQELMATIQAAEPTDENLWDVDLSDASGSWILDTESWDDELDHFFVLQ